MRKLLNTYFAISKKEFNGLLALIALILLIAGYPYLYRMAEPEGEKQQAEDLQAIRAVRDLQKGIHTQPKRERRSVRSERELFAFDPNTISLEGWQKLGLSARQSAAILNYRAKGGIFRKREDLKKMYTVSGEMYVQLLPYIRIKSPPTDGESRLERPFHKRPEYLRPAAKIIELNEADSAALTEIRGIGPAFARRIIKYRDRIGGFYKKEQLLEVFGLDSLKFSEISDQVRLDDAHLKPIAINSAEMADLKGHPYLRYKQINALIQYRKQHGNYTSIADLSKVLILDAETISRIAPYLNFRQ